MIELKRQELCTYLIDTVTDIQLAVNDVITAIGVVNLCPEGEYKNQALINVNNKKDTLQHLMKQYENAVNEYNTLIKQSSQLYCEMTRTANEIVEQAYQKYFKKN